MPYRRLFYISLYMHLVSGHHCVINIRMLSVLEEAVQVNVNPTLHIVTPTSKHL